MERALENVHEIALNFEQHFHKEEEEIEIADELKQKIRQAIVEIRMATDNIVGALESMVAECRLKQDFVERCRDIRQASHLRYGHLPLSFLSRGGAEQHNGFNAAGTALPKLRRSNAVHHHQDNQPDTPPVLEAVVATKRQKK